MFKTGPFSHAITASLTEGQYRALQRLSMRCNMSMGALTRMAVCMLIDYEAEDEHLALIKLKRSAHAA